MIVYCKPKYLTKETESGHGAKHHYDMYTLDHKLTVMVT